MIEGSGPPSGSDGPFSLGTRAVPSDALKNETNLSLDENPADDDSILEKLTPAQNLELQKQIELQWQISNASRIKWMNDRQEGLQLYWGIRRPKDFPFRNAANVHVPMIRTIMDTLHANIMGSIDPVKPASIVPVGPHDVPKAKKTEQLLNWQFSTQIDYTDLVDRAVHSALLYGMAPVKLRYVIERENGKKTYDGLKFEILPPERFLTPPDAADADVNAMDYVIHEVAMSKSDLKKRMLSGRYKTLSEEELDRTGENITRHRRYFDDFFENIRSIYSGVESINITTPEKRYATVMEYYGAYDYNGDGIDEPIMATYLKDRKQLLRVVKWNRRRPFVIVEFSYILNRALGESVPEILKILNQELDTLHNLNIDALTLANVPYFFFDPVAGYNPDEIRLAPGVGIPVNGSPSQAVYFPQMNTKFNEMSRAEQDLISYGERMLGAGANVQGVTQPKRITATEIQTIDRRSGIRFLLIFDRIRKSIRDIFKLALEYDKEYMPKELQVRITGLDTDGPIFETIKRDDLDAEVDIVINGNSILDEQADQQEMSQVYQIGMQNPLIMNNPTAMYELTRDLFTKLGVKRIDAYLHKPKDEIPKVPDDEHNLFMQEIPVEPNMAENMQEHLKAHADLINSKSFELLSKKGKLLLVKHYNATLKLQNQMEQMQLMNKLSAINAQLMAIHGGAQLGPSGQLEPPQAPPQGRGKPGKQQPPAQTGVPSQGQAGQIIANGQ